MSLCHFASNVYGRSEVAVAQLSEFNTLLNQVLTETTTEECGRLKPGTLSNDVNAKANCWRCIRWLSIFWRLIGGSSAQT